jgi:predicted DNA-binding transcriptional regulator AlpA
LRTEGVVKKGSLESTRASGGGVMRRKAEASAPRLLPAGLNPMVSIDDLMTLLRCSRRLVERLRVAGKVPRPDMMVGRCPRWKAATIRAWVDSQ